MTCPRHAPQEMDEAQIEQMRQLAAGGAGGAAPSERKDDPAVLTKLAATLVEDDAVLVLAELVAAAASRPGGSGASTLHTAARVLLSMATTPEARGKIVAQGGFKALLTCALCEHEPTATSAAPSCFPPRSLKRLRAGSARRSQT